MSAAVVRKKEFLNTSKFLRTVVDLTSVSLPFAVCVVVQERAVSAFTYYRCVFSLQRLFKTIMRWYMPKSRTDVVEITQSNIL